jgi:hypothetical protein
MFFLVLVSGMKFEGVLKPHVDNLKLFSISFHASGAGCGVQEQGQQERGNAFPRSFPTRSAAIAWRHSHVSTCLSEKDVKEYIENPGSSAKRGRKGGGARVIGQGDGAVS